MMVFVAIVVIYVIIANFWFWNRPENKNPYIKTHRRKLKIKQNYENYLQWLDSKGGDVPMKKITFHDDTEVIKEISKILNRK